MGVSTDGLLVYGISLDEDVVLPWEDDIEDWWLREVHGYEPPFQLYDQYGDYIDVEPTKEKVQEYHKHYREFQELHPLPVEVVRHCSYEYPMYIISYPGLTFKARRGYPEEIAPDKLLVEDVDRKIIDFCQQYDIDIGDQTPRWWLASMWG